MWEVPLLSKIKVHHMITLLIVLMCNIIIFALIVRLKQLDKANYFNRNDAALLQK